VAQRYCTNCGHELREEDRFCPSCGRPVHETAAVSTPEADVPVPPPPRQRTERGFAPQAEPPPQRSTANRLLLFGCMALGLIAVVLALVVGLALVASSGGGGSKSAGGGANSQNGAGPDLGGFGNAETFTNRNYAELYSDPKAHKGASVDITGQLLERPEVSGNELAFQMFVDAENSDWNTVVYIDQTDLDLNMDDYVRVRGEVLGSFEGENAFGGSITAPTVQASKVSTVSAGQAIDPATEVRQIYRTVGGQGFDVTLQKIEFGRESTRAYVTLANNTNYGASFYTFDAQIVQGSTQVDYLEDSYDYYDEEPQEELRPGVRTEGVIAFGPVNPKQPFQLRLSWSSDNYSVNTRPVVFQITP
jgi:zinc-ribbon domain